MGPADHDRIHRALSSLEGAGDDVPASARHAAVAVLLRGEALASSEVLLMRRARREGDRWSGQIGLPGGHAEEFDEDLVATARRESRKSGSTPKTEARPSSAPLPTIQARAPPRRAGCHALPHPHRLPPLRARAGVLGPEADEAFWLPIAEASSGALDEPYRYEHEGLIHKLPSWNYEGRVIWGMTHGILSRFIRALDAPA